MAGKPRAVDPTGERVAASIRRLRRDRELTTTALSQRLAELGHPIADTGITKIEKGQRRVDVDDLVALAVALGTTPNRLLLPEVDIPDTLATFPLTPKATEGRAGALWAWATGERPFGERPASRASGEEAMESEAAFVSENRRHHFGGSGRWIAATSADDAAEFGIDRTDDKLRWAATIGACVLSAFNRGDFTTSEIRDAVDSGIIAALVGADLNDQLEREIWEWLSSEGHDDDS